MNEENNKVRATSFDHGLTIATMANEKAQSEEVMSVLSDGAKADEAASWLEGIANKQDSDQSEQAEAVPAEVTNADVEAMVEGATPEQITGWVRDINALSVKLNKPASEILIEATAFARGEETKREPVALRADKLP